RENEEGKIENVYTLKIMNKAQVDKTFVIEVDGLSGLTFEGRQEVQVAAGELLSIPAELSIEPEKLPSSTNNIVFRVKATDDQSNNNEAESRFIGPTIR
ncbi:MAG TPA: FixG Ig-like domain-containing protein, partial [Pseudomonas sp.]|nr:FixG Ig-like domain-containing protein [Pseudomonas sp.]